MLLKRRHVLAGLAASPLAACATRLRGPGTGSLRVATFNIWHDAGDWAARLPLLLAALRQADPDVIALQEVLEDSAKGLPNQAQTLAASLGGYRVAFASTNPPGSPKRYGNAILSRLPILAEASTILEPLSDYRTAIRARVDVGGRLTDIVNTHLAYQLDAGAVRAEQIAHLLRWLPDDGVPVILMADFNAPLDDSGLAAIDRRRFESALPPGAATTTLNPAKGHFPRVIDHVFVDRSAFAVIGAQIIGNTPENGEYPSDHFGVAATLEPL